MAKSVSKRELVRKVECGSVSETARVIRDDSDITVTYSKLYSLQVAQWLAIFPAPLNHVRVQRRTLSTVYEFLCLNNTVTVLEHEYCS